MTATYTEQASGSTFSASSTGAAATGTGTAYSACTAGAPLASHGGTATGLDHGVAARAAVAAVAARAAVGSGAPSATVAAATATSTTTTAVAAFGADHGGLTRNVALAGHTEVHIAAGPAWCTGAATATISSSLLTPERDEGQRTVVGERLVGRRRALTVAAADAGAA